MSLETLWLALLGLLLAGYFVLGGYDYGVQMLSPFLGTSDGTSGGTPTGPRSGTPRSTRSPRSSSATRSGWSPSPA